jgi:hypothetical protein
MTRSLDDVAALWQKYYESIAAVVTVTGGGNTVTIESGGVTVDLARVSRSGSVRTRIR